MPDSVMIFVGAICSAGIAKSSPWPPDLAIRRERLAENDNRRPRFMSEEDEAKLDWDLRLRASDHCSELMRLASAEQMIRRACHGDQQPGRLLCRAMVWLGCHLVALGTRLQGRFARSAPARPVRVLAGR